MTNDDLAVEQDETLVEETELSEQERAAARLKEALVVEKEDTGPLQLKLTITIPSDILDERRREQFDELKRDSTVPGFRKGHAPLRLVEKRFASDVGEQLKTQLFSSGYLAAVEKEGLNVLGDPLFWVKLTEQRASENQEPREVDTERLLPIDKALDHLEVPKEGSLSFVCEVELKPEFDLPELTKIAVKRPKFQIDDDDVDIELRRMRLMRGTFQPVEAGAIEHDDMIYADLKITVDGDVIAEEENFDLAARDIHVKGVPMAGFGEAVVGKSIGDTIQFEAPVPDDHENIDLRGKTAKFEITIREIKRLVLPPIDERFLSNIGFESEADLRKFVRASLDSRVDYTLREAMREQVADHLVKNTKFEIPEGLSNRQTERTIARRMIELYQSGTPEAEIDKRMDELRASTREQVGRNLKLYFVLERIAEDREIDISEEEMNGAIARIAQRSNKRFDRVRDELSQGQGLTLLYHHLRDERVLDALLEDAVITETEGPKKKKVAGGTAKTATEAKAKKSEVTAEAPAKPKKSASAAKAASPASKTTKEKAAGRASAAQESEKGPKTAAKKAAKKTLEGKTGGSDS